MSDIYLQGATYPGVPAVTLPKTDSTLATFYELTKMYLPPSAELVASAEETYNLSADTSWDTWTPSTTNTSILAVGTARAACNYKITTDYEDTALIGFQLMHTDYAYTVTPAKGYQTDKRIMAMCHYAPLKHPNYATTHYGSVAIGAAYAQTYHTSATATTIYAGSAYGVGSTGCTWSTSSTTSASSRTVGFTRPIIYARCHSTYFTTTAAGDLDSANTNVYYKYLIYKIDKTESMLYRLFDDTNGELIITT